MQELIVKIARCLDEKGVPYMVIGGQAVLLYGRPRLTRDIDITLGFDSDKFDVMAQVCKEAGLKILPEEGETFARETGVLPVEDAASRLRVDFIFSFTAYEQQALKRTRKVELSGYPVHFASCEDVIIHKLLAGRAVDDEDVKSILARHAGEIDRNYIEEWLDKFKEMPEYAGVRTKWDELR
jgi:predicted nucleotidyltransferase